MLLPRLRYQVKFYGNGTRLLHILGREWTRCRTRYSRRHTDAAYVAGTTNSTNFPTTTGAAQASLGGGTCGKKPSNTFDCPDAFVAKLEPSGTSLAYSTYLGGNSFDFGMGIAVDSAYNAYVVGGTDSLDFPTDANTGNFQGGTCSIPTTGIFQT